MDLRTRLLRTGLVFGLLALPLVPLAYAESRPCVTLGDCLTAAYALLGYVFVVLPLLSWLGLWVAKVPRSALVALAGLVAGWGTYLAIGAVDEGAGVGRIAAQVAAAVLAATVVGALVGALVARPAISRGGTSP